METYVQSEVAWFSKTKERFGGLSNMAGWFPIIVDGTIFRTSEALYQAMRFPHRPDIQEEIIKEKSPMSAKMVARKHIDESRKDWLLINIDIMKWCLELKLMMNYEKFAELLLSTKPMTIVEFSKRDDFWGAKPDDSGNLVGSNQLGKLLTNLRDRLSKFTLTVYTPDFPQMKILSKAVSPVLVPPCLAYWHEGMLNKSDKPSGYCSLPRNHEGDHCFPGGHNGNGAPEYDLEMP